MAKLMACPQRLWLPFWGGYSLAYSLDQISYFVGISFHVLRIVTQPIERSTLKKLRIAVNSHASESIWKWTLYQ